MPKVVKIEGETFDNYVEIGWMPSHPHLEIGRLLKINDTMYSIRDIQPSGSDVTVAVWEIQLGEQPITQVHDEIVCPYCESVWSDGYIGQANDTIFDCPNCYGASHVQRFIGGKILDEEVDLVLVSVPKMRPQVIEVNLTRQIVE